MAQVYSRPSLTLVANLLRHDDEHDPPSSFHLPFHQTHCQIIALFKDRSVSTVHAKVDTVIHHLFGLIRATGTGEQICAEQRNVFSR
jgi:hypothetical protein